MNRSLGRRAMSLSASLVLLLVAGGCAQGSSDLPQITASPLRATGDVPLQITVSGLSAHRRVTVRARTSDAQGYVWTSTVTLDADASGMLDLANAVPISGSYHGADAMGLFRSMTPASASSLGIFHLAKDGERVELSVDVDGKAVATQTVTRLWNDPRVVAHPEQLSDRGFFGVYEAPPDTSTRHPAVLVFGGSEGGLSGVGTAVLLASHGYPALAIAYFGAPGLPQALSNIPLEYFVKALTWLRSQPGVDPAHLFTYGVSRGSEAALLLGALYPDLVRGVIALVPSDVSLCSLTCDGPVWTVGGAPLPYTHEFSTPHPTDDPNAEIAVEKINGPVFLDCGGSDRVWRSCDYADAIISRLVEHHASHQHVLLSYPDGGHGVGALAPYFPGIEPASTEGITREANPAAREQGWPRLLDFLAAAK
ncbi:MAG TPA: acyl-CoA thioesterase/BAAT N-terminal domain-containing protein [Isosphaeraceae bacterium]|nr:acyl-CoA thioesterase/BAAT N-terminal domain-containing protein [Isosphaeraceae bacterium]